MKIIKFSFILMGSLFVFNGSYAFAKWGCELKEHSSDYKKVIITNNTVSKEKTVTYTTKVSEGEEYMEIEELLCKIQTIETPCTITLGFGGVANINIGDVCHIMCHRQAGFDTEMICHDV